MRKYFALLSFQSKTIVKTGELVFFYAMVQHIFSALHDSCTKPVWLYFTTYMQNGLEEQQAAGPFYEFQNDD